MIKDSSLISISPKAEFASIGELLVLATVDEGFSGGLVALVQEVANTNDMRIAIFFISITNNLIANCLGIAIFFVFCFFV